MSHGVKLSAGCRYLPVVAMNGSVSQQSDTNKAMPLSYKACSNLIGGQWGAPSLQEKLLGRKVNKDSGREEDNLMCCLFCPSAQQAGPLLSFYLSLIGGCTCGSTVGRYTAGVGVR